MPQTRTSSGADKGRCSEDGCTSQARTKGMCSTHYKRHRYWITSADPRAGRPAAQSLPGETWRPIPGYEGSHEASDLGRIRSIDRVVDYGDGRRRRRKGTVLKGTRRHKAGHLYVNLANPDIQGVHRLVLLAFVGPAPEGMEGCHNDGDATNNRLDNLRWDTRSANNYDRVKHGRHPARQRTHCPRGHPLRMPNLRAARWQRGFRDCLACHRASALISSARRKGVLLNFQEHADKYYERIMAS